MLNFRSYKKLKKKKKASVPKEYLRTEEREISCILILASPVVPKMIMKWHVTSDKATHAISVKFCAFLKKLCILKMVDFPFLQPNHIILGYVYFI